MLLDEVMPVERMVVSIKPSYLREDANLNLDQYLTTKIEIIDKTILNLGS